MTFSTDPAQAKGVRTQHPDYRAYCAKWRRCRDAAGGESAVHDAGELYLPKLANEENKDYVARLRRTPFFNATWRTVSGLRGMLFRKPAAIDAPASLPFDDIDMAGTPLQSFVQQIVGEALTVGRVGLLVDYPQAATDEGVTVAQAQQMGLRPALSIYPAESIINWKTERIGNATVLSQVVLTEQVALDADDMPPGTPAEDIPGEFDNVSETRYRVLDLVEGRYRQRVFRIQKDDQNALGRDVQVGDDVFPLMNGATMAFIPFVIVGVDTIGTKVEDPPLIDLVDMNLHHYQVSADYEHGCHFSGLPTLFISGYSAPDAEPGKPQKAIYIGGPVANCLPQPDSKAYFVEITSDFAALRANLEDKKAQMAVLGARMLEVQKARVETAETAAQHRKGEESMLAAMAQTVSLGVQKALQWFADWAGVSGATVSYELNRDFLPARLDANGLTALVGAWQAGAISGETLFDNLQGGEVIEPDVTYEEEQARIANAPPRLAGAAPDTASGGGGRGGAAV